MLDGGAGADAADYWPLQRPRPLAAHDGVVGGDAQGDTLSGIETSRTAFADALTSDTAANAASSRPTATTPYMAARAINIIDSDEGHCHLLTFPVVTTPCPEDFARQ